MSFRLADESSCGYSSGGDSGDEGDRFPDSAGGHRRQSAPPQPPLMRMNSDSIYDMSGMTAHLPAKKGLSAYYQGKSQSFACMSEVRSLEDLQKKEKPPRRIKPCKSYATLGAGGMPAKQVPAASSCANLGLMAAGNGFGRASRNIPLNQDCYHQ
ncbi:uncharacterized protein LOC124649828 [Lolium rigidum]|uniref:uncharacterized protein LOC124649828 n=1 Tax=Lolium rigidum TaxID=89674 RepID=UPI001F5CC3A2|nr:uncharacterized protein LOC124649828 [Lolium rigidum]